MPKTIGKIPANAKGRLKANTQDNVELIGYQYDDKKIRVATFNQVQLKAGVDVVTSPGNIYTVLVVALLDKGEKVEIGCTFQGGATKADPFLLSNTSGDGGGAKAEIAEYWIYS